MKDPMNFGGLVPKQDSYALSKSNATQAYILECKLRRILEKEAPRSEYSNIHEQSGISRKRIEEAVEGRVYRLSFENLQIAISLFEEEGLIPLIHFLDKLRKYSNTEGEVPEVSPEDDRDEWQPEDDCESEDEEEEIGDMETLMKVYPPLSIDSNSLDHV